MADPEPDDLPISSAWTKSAPAEGPPSGATRSLTPGTVLAGRYRIVALLGRGGMGEIYRAEDLKLGQAVALKFVRGKLSPEALARLYAEVRVGRQVSHPNVCRLYDVAEFEGETFLTMEYVDGEDLASLLARIGRVPPDKAKDLARDLCAGLAAVHDRGVVHRDLKPANVMVDGRGQARLTDFGLALAGETPREAGGAGTPAYMSPEQLEGREATPRSDVYALGLVLFEMFTGRRFFDARTLPDLTAQHREAKGPRLASAASVLEAGLDQMVGQCLEEDPEARPASARVLLAQLPGGDPLEAAVAAGETPSPDMVAAATRVGDLRPIAAWTALLAAAAGLLLIANLSDRASLLRGRALPRTPEALAERARHFLNAQGLSDAADSAYSFEQDQALIDHVRTDPSPDRWARMRRSAQVPFVFYLRQSPRPLVAENRDGRVTRVDPRPDVSGMAEVLLDVRGRLLAFTLVPPQVEASPDVSPEAPPEPEWSPFFREAELEAGALLPARSEWAAPVDSDRKWAWTTEAAGERPPLRIEAAAYRGRPVWFRVLTPWARPERMAESRSAEPPNPVGRLAVGVLALALPLGGIVLARRNVRLGRVDRKGAFRVALFIFGTYTVARLFRADHSAVFGSELWTLIKVFAYPAFWAILVALLYLALEPYARRRWPHMLISWKRLLGGSFRDPLVGRDVLIGCVVGLAAHVTFLVSVVGPTWLVAIPATPHPLIDGGTLTSLRHVGFRLFVNQFSAVLFALVFLFMLVLLRMLVRRTGPAMALWCLLLGGPLLEEGLLVGWTLGLARALLYLFALSKGGLLGLATGHFMVFVLLEVPPTLDLGTWYASRALPVMAVLLGLAVYGFRTALAGKPAFGRRLLED